MHIYIYIYIYITCVVLTTEGVLEVPIRSWPE